MTDLKELIERVEALTEPDRAVDARIQQALFPDQRVLLDGGKAFGPGPKRPAKYGVLADVDLSDWDDASADPGDKDGLAGLFEAPFYTASTDAAIALTERMLPGWRMMMQEGNAYDNGIYQAHSGCTLYHPLSSGAPTVKGFAPTLPLAILAALLRALQEQEK